MEGEETAIISGGTWVVPEMSHHLRRPKLVIDLKLAGLAGVSAEADAVVIGPATTYTQLAHSKHTPNFLKKVVAGITGGSQIRNRGTIGGSACYANPASDIPGALVTMKASLHLRAHSSTRIVEAADFFLDANVTLLEPDEILESISIPSTNDENLFSYAKFKTAQGSWPIVTIGCIASEDGVARRVIVGGAGAIPFAVDLDGQESEDEVLQRVHAAMRQPWSDVFATADTRRHIAGVMTQRAVREIAAAKNGEKS
ncbi:CO/xanthine dehydrogenase FAD-binding subunit [Arthrobacter psychrochitiniphilus]|nr:CO/xanthine dehydrogenase FAD-binding subunit [Arthrobacter psychrochitiniphilus]